MKPISADDKNIIWSGAISLEYSDGYVKPWRIPFTEKDLYSPSDSSLATPAAMPSGVRLRFSIHTRILVLHIQELTETTSFDLYTNDILHATAECSVGQTEVHFSDLPDETAVFEIWLSHSTPVSLRAITVSEKAKIIRTDDKRPRWITYGSSISHCRSANSPSFTWPGIVARAQNFNLTSLGFGGQCHADPMIARLIRDRPADFISTKIGINIYGGSSLNARTFRPAVIGTIATIRDGHPDTPFVVCSPIWGHYRETENNSAGMTLIDMRIEIQEAVESFQSRGDKNIHYIDGLKLFDESLSQYLPDNLHPNSEGYKIMANRFIHEVFEIKNITT
ncbi:MAG: SGNH/GDSL hydrolase family protein [Candidatus Latescibacterota bacterium]|nr:SGNH/GDSL hydrolase family protein [Candidatus Latescibacterota bacterium]